MGRGFILCTCLLWGQILAKQQSQLDQLNYSGNCGGGIVMECSGSAIFSFTFFHKDKSFITNNDNTNTSKYNAVTRTTSVQLTILDIEPSDEGEYRCLVGFDLRSNDSNVDIYCKATSVSVTVLPNKRLQIASDRLYPNNPTLSLQLDSQSSSTSAASCVASADPDYYKCTWTTTQCLSEGTHPYSLIVTTRSASETFTGSSTIATPSEAPVISNVFTINNIGTIVRGYEGQSVTIICTSSGGNPTQTVAWYKGSVIPNTHLNITSSGTQQGDGTYTVILSYTFTPQSSDDLSSLICQSSYPDVDAGCTTGNMTKMTSVLLYLYFRCSTPTVTQTNSVVSGESLQMSCRVSGCRPEPSMTWIYNGLSSSATVNSSSETSDSFFMKQVTAADNGQDIVCRISQSPTGFQDQTGKGSINVLFGPSPGTTEITGNRIFTVGESATLILKCTTGSSNPASNITWDNIADITSSTSSYQDTSGGNNGIKRSQNLILTVTRNADKTVITCAASNSVNTQQPVTSKVTLDLRYHPIVTTVAQRNYKEGYTGEPLPCSADSNPIANFTWRHDETIRSTGSSPDNSFPYNISKVSRQQYGTYTCEAANNISPSGTGQTKVNIQFPPLSTAITGNTNIIANGQTPMDLICTTGSSNPISDIVWQVNGVDTDSTASLADQGGEYGGQKRRRQLTLKPTRDYDNYPVSCEARYNGVSQNVAATIMLDSLKYSAEIIPMDNRTYDEGTPNVKLGPCIASSKPPATFKWYKDGNGQDVLHQGDGTIGNNALPYVIPKLQRENAGPYRCNAYNRIGNPDNRITVLTVNYPPDVSVIATNTTTDSPSASVSCEANGIPASYGYGQWEHSWPGYGILQTLPSHQELTLNDLTYEFSGLYTCFASNNIPVYGTSKLLMSGTAYLRVESFPIITSPRPENNTTFKVSSKLRQTASFNIELYSNTDDDPDVTLYNVNTTVQFTDDVQIGISKGNIKLPVFSHTVNTAGFLVNISFMILSSSNFTEYTVFARNTIGETSLGVLIVPEGPPETPTILSISDIQYTSAQISWVRGYYNGYEQFFVIQQSKDASSWRNASEVAGGISTSREPLSVTISNLDQATSYYVRLYAYNIEGSSNVTEMVNFTTFIRDKKPPKDPPSALIGGVVGGVAGLLIIVAVILFFVIRGRRSKDKSGREDHMKLPRMQQGNPEDDSDDEDVINPLYGQSPSTSAINNESALYATPQKPGKSKPSVDSNDVYAQVIKPKQKNNDASDLYATPVKKDQKQKQKNKGKKGKETKQKHTDVYENSPAISGDKAHENNAYEENAYENPESAKVSPKKNVNKDGLIYADLEFADQPKNQKRLVIHGLDDMTEYAEVDLTKKAEPLPDDDEELKK